MLRGSDVARPDVPAVRGQAVDGGEKEGGGVRGAAAELPRPGDAAAPT